MKVLVKQMNFLVPSYFREKIEKKKHSLFMILSYVERLQLLRDFNLIRPASSTPSSLDLGGPSRCALSKMRALRCPFRHSAKPYCSPPSDNR